jgi:hypothetical protein
MLAGRLPFDTDDPVVLLHHQLNEEFPPLPDAVPGTLQEIVRRMCDKEKAKRYASASAVLADIEAFLYDATDGDFAASSSSTRSWGSATPSAPRSRPNKVRPSSKDSSDARPGRPWWQWGMAAGLVLLAGVVAVPMMTEEETATATATLVATAPTPPPPATAESPVDASDRTRFLSLLAKVNDRNHPLPFDARRQSLQLLADSAYASKVDTRLHTGLDLVQASESSTPCATFREALSTIEDSGDAYYVAYASQAEVPQAGPTEPAEACQELEGMLERARKALSGQDEPEEDEVRRVAAATRTSKRRAARRRSETEESSKSPESEPSPQDTTETKKTDPPPKLPPAPKTEVPKLDRPELRDL